MIRVLPLLALLLLPAAVFGQTAFRQLAEVQPAIEKGAERDVARPTVAVDDSQFHEGPNAEWIWGIDNDTDYVLRFQFQADANSKARLKASCDNVGTVFLNGKQVASSTEWQAPMDVDVSSQLVDGDNLVEAKVANAGGIAAFVLHLVIVDQQGNAQHVVSDTSWDVAFKRDGASIGSAERRGLLGDAPWRNVFENSDPNRRVPQGVFEVLPGFQVEKLFTVPKDELGSWVCITFDDKGRLLASDQGDKGICRITLPPASTESDTVVERLDFSQCEIQPTGAQGMLWAFNSLYLSINGGPGSGLYRARDTDGDDQFDECVRLRSLQGGGEHGPHSLRLSPDGKRIFIICGNHTDPPFNPGEELTNENYSSRVPTNWDEDLLLPRMWDANGHARGKLAPGGWIASTDPDGESWQIWSSGYRNPYDLAFNADGELFAYDADMEWDFGLPWYRPTRVVHATAGSEFGWRSGSGKWPTYYLDSLPPIVNIGPGSPVGVEFGYGPPLAADSEAAQMAGDTFPSEQNADVVFAPLKFPAKYQKALFICDWTFGTMYAIHMTPELSSYAAVKQEFVSRSPLPLTDVAAGSDGALYFTVGGRGTQSELYRVRYVGDADTTLVPPTESRGKANRQLRYIVESLIRPDSTIDDVREVLERARAAGLPVEQLRANDTNGDRALWMALRRAMQVDKQLSSFLFDRLQRASETSDVSDEDRVFRLLQVFTAFAHGSGRNGLDPNDVGSVATRILLRIDFDKLDVENRLNFLRTLSLTFLRLNAATEETAHAFDARLTRFFPTGESRVDRELCQMLVYLNSPAVIDKTIELLRQTPIPTVPENLTDLIARNRGYGSSIAAMLKSAPDQQQVWYAYCLRCANVGWTLESRAEFYRWCGRAKQWSGGNSYRKFIQNMEDEAWSKTPENERVLLEAMQARTPFRMPELPKPVGPGHDWSLQEVRGLAESELHGRNFDNGQKMFAATRCVLCHRFAGDGGATGPDLTQLAGRFNIKDLTEAIMDPSKVISDQYKGSTVVTSDGRTVVGRVVSENADQISVLADPEDSTQIVDINKSDIDEILPSQVSTMPKDLLNQLNQDEMLDLLAYLLSRGDKSNRMFKR
jgi:putative heme-binding domain-containing protein